MKYFKQKINNQFLKPVRINLLFGNFRIISHESSTVEIEGALNRTYLVSTLKDEGSFITIQGQKFLSIFSGSHANIIIIKVPHNVTVYCKIFIGSITPIGVYKCIELEVMLGKLQIDFEKFKTETYGYFQLFLGHIRLKSLPKYTNQVDINSKKRNYKFFDGTSLLTSLKLGKLSIE